jgi:hypothetical protein
MQSKHEGAGPAPLPDDVVDVSETMEQLLHAGAQADLLHPRLQRLACLLRDLKLHGSLRLLLDDDGTFCHKDAMADIADTQSHQNA